MVTMSKLHQLRFQLLPHPPYSPDLALTDFSLFSNLKKFLGGKILVKCQSRKTCEPVFLGLGKELIFDGLISCEKR